MSSKTTEERLDSLEEKLKLICNYLFKDGKIKTQDDEDEEDKMFSLEEKVERVFEYLEIDMKRATPGVTIKRM